MDHRHVRHRSRPSDADVIVIGSHERGGVSRLLLGSVAETVIRRATMPVTVVR
ncbi:MAG: universal stress protein [Halobacteriales archaeon]